ncbi:hypothetical protein ACFWU8_15835, partial [Bacillus subtilis]
MESQNDAKEEKIRYETVNLDFYYVLTDYVIDNGRHWGGGGRRAPAATKTQKQQKPQRKNRKKQTQTLQKDTKE